MRSFISKFINIPFILGVSFVFFSFILGIFLRNGLIIFLSWNMILALMVYVFSSIALELHERQFKWIWIVISIGLWILFFPNSFYILTDTIHFQNYEFFKHYPNIYELDSYEWYVFFDITIAALISLKIGLMSLEQIKKIVPNALKQYQLLLIIGLFFISSIGIYLGRFIRLNSWNIFDLSSIISGVLEHFNFFVVFVLLFTMIHLIAYYLYKNKGEH
ncbi:MAG: DUF1361 domain-containing protein [Acholeplasmataceae bacterium]